MRKLLKLFCIFVECLDSKFAVRSPIWLIISDIFNYYFYAGTLYKVNIISKLANFLQLNICNKKYFVFI